MNIALIGFGNVGRAFARLLEKQKATYPFRIVAIHTARQGTAYNLRGLAQEPMFGPAADTIEQFLDKAQAEVAVEITSLNPSSGEPAISHIRAAFARGIHVITANKGPIAVAYQTLAKQAAERQLLFRFESTVMDGTPVFSLVRQNLPGVKILGFSGVFNSTTQVVLSEMRKGRTIEEGIRVAQQLGIAEADASFDIDGWDSASKTAALANVLMNAAMTPLQVDRKGIGKMTPERLAEIESTDKTVALVARARTTKDGIRLRVRAEVLDKTDPLACLKGTSNLLQLETDLMGTLGIVEMNPTVEQTAYGIFSDLVDIAKSI